MTKSPIYSDEQHTRRLLVRYHQHGDMKAREQIIEENLPLAEYLASRYAGRGEPRGDLVQAAYVGLIKAVDRFDISRPSKFSYYASPTIVGEVKHYFRDKGWTVYVPRKAQELSQKVRDIIREETQLTGCVPSPQEVAEITGVDI